MRLKKLGLTRKAVATCLLLTALASVAFVLATPTPAAADRCGTQFDYYADPGLTQYLGTRVWLPYACSCQFFSSGTTGPYVDISDSVC
jgi:hypothetical protein